MHVIESCLMLIDLLYKQRPKWAMFEGIIEPLDVTGR
jgi:hypothetical protein